MWSETEGPPAGGQRGPEALRLGSARNRVLRRSGRRALPQVSLAEPEVTAAQGETLSQAAQHRGAGPEPPQGS